MQIGSIASQLLRYSLSYNPEFGASQNKDSSAGQITNLVSLRVNSKSKQSYFGHNPTFRPSFEFVAQYSAADVYEQTDVIETQDVFETRPIYEDQAILETRVDGSRDLSGFDSLSQTGIAKRARFSVTVGDGPQAKIKFEDAGTISVRVNASIQEFTFQSDDGSFRTGLLDALNSIGGLSASYTKDGRLSLETSDGASLTLADIRKSPLAKLGMTEGTANAEVIGYEQVQVGVEQVKVGEQAVVVGKDIVSAGTKQVFDGYEAVLAGLERSQLFDTQSLAAKFADDDSITSPKNYAETLFGIVRAEKSGTDPLASLAEATSAYDTTLSESDQVTGKESDNSWPPADNLLGWP